MGMTKLGVKPDTPEWLEARRGYVMASDAAAVLGLSPYRTALDVWHAKRGGHDDIDPMLAWVGHRMEPVIADWLRRFHKPLGPIRRGFMAVSDEWPWLGATVDRVLLDGTPVELKTANRHGMKRWLDDAGTVTVPLDYQVQVQAQLAVTGKPRAHVAVALAGSDFELLPVDRDDAFIQEHLIPRTREFHDMVRDGVMPPPANLAEQAVTWPTQTGTEIEASDIAVEAFERWQVVTSDMKALDEESNALKAAIGEYMGDHHVLTRGGRPIAKLRTQAGRRAVSVTALEENYPELVDELVTQGAPFKVLQQVKEKK